MMWYRNLSDDIVKKHDIICHPLSWIPTPKVPQLVKFLTRWNMHSPDGIKTAFEHWFNPIGTVFQNNTKIKSFDELTKFKGSLLRSGMFQGCTNIQFVSVSYTRVSLFNDNVTSYKRILLKGEWNEIPNCFIWGANKEYLEAIILEDKIPPIISEFCGFFYGNHTNNYAKIFVPDSSLDLYVTAEVWEKYKEYIHPMSEYNL